MRRAKKTTIARDREYHSMEKAGFKASEPKMVQYAREYAKKVEEKQGEQKTGKEKKIRLQNGKM